MSGIASFRHAARGATALVLVAVAVLGAAPLAHAAGRALPDGTFVACPDVTTLAYSTTYSCENLTSAITAAEAWNANSRENATIDLLPGQYCPVQLPYDPYPLTIQGVGFAGVKNASDVDSYTGFEADLSEFTWSDAHCTAIAGDDYFLENQLNLQEPAEIWGTIDLVNFTVNGAGSGAPTSGVDITNAPLSVRDLLVENVSQYGFDFTDSEDFYNGNIENSAFIDNGVGAFINAGQSHGVSIDESTFAGNTEYGVDGGGFFVLGGDTIAHNVDGIGGSIDQLASSIVGDNTSFDCDGAISEDAGDNVLGGDCNPNTTLSDPDKTLTSTIGSLSTGDAITPSIQPVTEAAIGAAECGNIDGTDQEELVADDSSCDAGSVQTAGTSADPAPSGDIDFGAVATNDPMSQTERLSAGGGLVSISGVDADVTSGTGGFAVTSDNCTYAPLLVASFGQGACSVTVQATSADDSGATAGTLTIHTSDGDITVNLASSGAPAVQAAGAPTGLTPTAGNRRVTLGWTAPTDDGGVALQYYEIDDSTNGGASWQVADTDYDTTDSTISDTIGNLTNGTPYDFRIRAENGVVDGSWSDVVWATPKGPQQPSALSAPHSTTITYGKRATLSAKLTDKKTGAPIAGGKVKLLDRGGRSGGFHTVTTVTTTSGGIAKAAVKPTVNTEYEFSYSTTSAHAAATSGIATVRVAQAVKAALSKTTTAHGSKVEVYGVVRPAASGERVTLEVEVNGKWKKVGGAKTKHQKLPNGTQTVGYVITFTSGKVGKVSLRVVRSADATNASGRSKKLKLDVT
ncbi:MAG TPA: fibronectin type III domain-containing protein [Mycobacteriales bacterium]|nr:fibronectin type III domain-containing protein [Mycobacteriales bacterium]